LQIILRTIRYFLTDCKDTSTLNVSQFFFFFLFTKECERKEHLRFENKVFG